MYEGCVSLEVQRSDDDEYVLFKSVQLDDTLIKKIGEGCKELNNVAHRVSTPRMCRVVGEYNKHIWIEDG